MPQKELVELLKKALPYVGMREHGELYRDIEASIFGAEGHEHDWKDKSHNVTGMKISVCQICELRQAQWHGDDFQIIINTCNLYSEDFRFDHADTA